MEDKVADLIGCLTQIEDDAALPRNIKQKIRNAINALGEEKEFKIKANKALRELDDVSDSPNVPSYIRPQIWNVVSMLESA